MTDLQKTVVSPKLARSQLLTALVQGAAADPSGAKHSFAFPATCDDGQTVSSSPLPGGPIQTETDTSSKPNVHGDLVTCSFDASQTTPGGTFRIFGSATGFFTPAS